MTKRGPNNEVVWAPGNLYFFLNCSFTKDTGTRVPMKKAQTTESRLGHMYYIFFLLTY